METFMTRGRSYLNVITEVGCLIAIAVLPPSEPRQEQFKTSKAALLVKDQER